MLYFAYGSNMSLRRLRARTPSARLVTTAALHGHQLRFHKAGRDGSAKCDAYATGDPSHQVIGVVFELEAAEKPALDIAEGLGLGYQEKTADAIARGGHVLSARTYYATHIDPHLHPFVWYKYHVLTGGRENGLPAAYLLRIEEVMAVPDPLDERHRREMAIYAGM